MFTITRYAIAEGAAINNQHQWPVRFTVVEEGTTTPAKIFVMQEAVEGDVIAGDSFSCVASAIQMTDLPADAPEAGSPFFRVADVTVLARSAKAAEEFVEKVKYAAQELADNLLAATSLEVVEELTIIPRNV